MVHLLFETRWTDASATTTVALCYYVRAFLPGGKIGDDARADSTRANRRRVARLSVTEETAAAAAEVGTARIWVSKDADAWYWVRYQYERVRDVQEHPADVVHAAEHDALLQCELAAA